MKNNVIRGRTLAVIATTILMIVSLGSLGLYYATQYYLYFLLFITTLFLGTTNLFFLVLKFSVTRDKKTERTRKKDVKVSAQQKDKEVESNVKKQNGFSLHKILLIILFVVYVLFFYYFSTMIISIVKIVVNHGVLSFEEIVPLGIIPVLIILITVTVLDKFLENSKTRVKENEALQEVTQETNEKTGVQVKKNLRVTCIATYVFVLGYCCLSSLSFVKKITNEGIPPFSYIIPLLIILIVVTVVEKLCEYSRDNSIFVDTILQNSRLFCRLIILETLLASACVIIESLELFNIQKYIGYLFVGLLLYYLGFVTISLVITIIRKELFQAPCIVIPVPFIKNQVVGREQSFLDYLQDNTGITLRNLWSIKFIRDIAPAMVFMIGILLWLSTCIVQVENHQQAVVYRLGALQDEVFEPGLHLTLPYPIDMVEIYETEKVNKVTIGYKSQENTDNIWTEAHQGEEYILLLGSGDEVVSINLRVEYKINDLKQYLSTSASPESIMQALAYELVTDQTIATDLSTLMSADRAAFSEKFKQELSGKIQEKELGLEIVAVILESIHPPIDIASVYQELVSAGIKAQQYIAKAEGNAAVTIAKAEATYDTSVSTVMAEHEKKLAKAKLSVAEFMASMEAYNTYPDSYKYYKYLDAVKKAYGNANLVIVGEGVDTSALYFGSLFDDEKSTTEE